VSCMPGQSPRSSSGYRDRNSTADRALDVLQLFSDSKLVWSGAEIAERFGVARSTGYRYLKGLVTAGFIEECDGGFRLGPQVFELARLARKGLGLSEIAKPVMRGLADATDETVLLTRRSRTAVVCVELEESGRPIRISYERGHILPINAGAAAQVLLAWLPEDEAEAVLAAAPLHKFTPRTVTDVGLLQSRFRQIREAGYAVSRGELDPDVLGVAAPIRDTSGDVVAAVSIAALAFRIADSDMPKITKAVCEAADQISARLQQIDA
jgi:DNA-binding IclR family transcriptional regulator